MVEFPNTISALLAVASPSERAEYEAGLAAASVNDGYGSHRFDPPLEPVLLARLMEKLESGEWIASGFGYESGQPAELHPRLWQRLIINVTANSAHDRYVTATGRSITGSFHSLGFTVVKSEPRVAFPSERESVIEKLKTLLEQLDDELPSTDSKADFFWHAKQRICRPIKNIWLVQAWKDADLQDFRRLPGAKPQRKSG